MEGRTFGGTVHCQHVSRGLWELIGTHITAAVKCVSYKVWTVQDIGRVCVCVFTTRVRFWTSSLDGNIAAPLGLQNVNNSSNMCMSSHIIFGEGNGVHWSRNSPTFYGFQRCIFLFTGIRPLDYPEPHESNPYTFTPYLFKTRFCYSPPYA
jgi:hypothetical protein